MARAGGHVKQHKLQVWQDALPSYIGQVPRGIQFTFDRQVQYADGMHICL